MAFVEGRKFVVVKTAEALAEAAALHLVQCTGNTGERHICLTGGSTPQRLYKLLATEPWRSKVPWDRVHWFIGDDRFVPESDPLSNMGTARRLFLDACSNPDRIHPIPMAADPHEAARLYAEQLAKAYGGDTLESHRPLFDLVLMGMGSDGHTASLFPNAPALEETQKWVVGVDEAGLEPFVPRVTLTLPALASSNEMLFLVSGHDKKPVLERLLADEELPAGHAYSNGTTIWLLDRAAAPETLRAG